MKPLPLILALSLLHAASVVQGATLFSNLGPPPEPIDVQISLTTHLAATEFTTGAIASTLTGVHIHVENGDSIDHTFAASLYSDVSGGPGGLLATFAPVTNLGVVTGGNAQLMEFSHAGFALAPATTYWLALGILEDTNSGSYAGFNGNSSDTVFGVTGFSNSTPPKMHFSSNSGATWTPHATFNNGMFMLVGSVVPEPDRVLLLTAGILATVLRRRRSA